VRINLNGQTKSSLLVEVSRAK